MALEGKLVYLVFKNEDIGGKKEFSFSESASSISTELVREEIEVRDRLE